jgi:methylmalonyl-CoA mutase N-terminal domain/subunit
VINTIDPLAGSYFIEARTTEMEEAAEDYFRRIDGFGGVVKAIERGFFQREIQKSAYEYQKAVEAGRKVIVGLNRFGLENEEIEIPLLRIDEDVERQQKKAIHAVRADRDNDKVARELERLKAAAEGTENLMPVIIDCVRCYATEGEIIDTMKGVFGEYKEPLFV